jgi:hypothetical protein
VQRFDDQDVPVVVEEQQAHGGERAGAGIGLHALQYDPPKYMLASRQ